jgi:hypothetical protein
MIYFLYVSKNVIIFNIYITNMGQIQLQQMCYLWLWNGQAFPLYSNQRRELMSQ